MSGSHETGFGNGVDALRESFPVESRALLEQLYRYAQVGRCVSSVTHDVNNLLGAVLAYAELVQLDANIADDSRRMLGEVTDAARKCSTLVNNLTSVARKERPDATLVEPSSLVAHVLDLRRYDIKVNRVTLEEDYQPNMPSLVIDRPKFEMAVIYMVNNAMEAVSDAADRRMRVKLASADDRILVTVWNSGPAIDVSERESIFEPYYTTKGPNHLGLGLHLARVIAQCHDGELFYHPDQGFVLSLPLLNGLAKRVNASS